MIQIIINPVSGKGKGAKAAPIIEKKLKERGEKYSLELSRFSTNAIGLTKNVNDPKKIIAVGGDGTILEIIEGLGDKNIPIGIIPAGTGNDAAKALGIPRNINKAIDIALDGEIKAFDIIKVNEKSFLNISSLGIDAEIVATAAKIKKTFGKSAYLISAIINILTYKPIEAEIRVNGESIKGKFSLVAVANGNFYGGGFNIAPDANMADGLIELVVVKKIPNFLMMILFPSILIGKHKYLSCVKIYRTNEIKIIPKYRHKLNIDGDITENIRPLQYNIIKKIVKICVPKK